MIEKIHNTAEIRLSSTLKYSFSDFVEVFNLTVAHNKDEMYSNLSYINLSPDIFMIPDVAFSFCNAELTLCVTQLLDLLASTNASSLDTILDSVFNAMFLQVTIFWTSHVSSGDTFLDYLQCHIPLGDTVLNSVFNAMFLQVTLF
jgi:hypothetical protein